MDVKQKDLEYHYLLSALLNYVDKKEIAIPEIHRLFVWDDVKYRELIVTIYKGYPIGYTVIWKIPEVKLKDCPTSSGKKRLIEGQQSVTGLTAAILRQTIINTEYEDVGIKIAFNTIELRFDVSNPTIQKDGTWIADITQILIGEQKQSALHKLFYFLNPDMEDDEFYE